MVPRETKHSIKVFCLNLEDDAEAYSLLIGNPKVKLNHMCENWDTFGNFRIVVHIEEDIDKRPMPNNEDDDE